VTVRTRRAVFLVAACVLIAMLAWGFDGLPKFGSARASLGTSLDQLAVTQRHITDAVTAVNFDYRGFDTLGEEFIFFAAALGITLILRQQPGERPGHVADHATGRAVPPTSDAVRVTGLGLTPPTVVFGLYVIAHGHLTPGGGFQGGVILATAVLLVYLAGEYEDLHGLYTETALERAEAIGAGGYIALGLVGVAAGGAFLENVLPFGRTGRVFSAGIVPLINLTVGLEIMAGLVLLLTSFLHQVIVVRGLGPGPRSTATATRL
jgi:multicomponent Na+:H+ antiporter subunit B